MTAAVSMRGGAEMSRSSTIGMVWKPTGAPRIATGPKITKLVTKTRIDPPTVAGSTSGSVTLRSTLARPAPKLAAACSRAGSTLLSAAETGRNTSGWRNVERTKMIPQGVKMSNGGSSRPNTAISVVLIRPFWPSNRIQPSAAMKLGAAKVSTALVAKNLFAGRSVRLTRYASGVAIRRLPTTVPAPIQSELSVAPTSSGSRSRLP
jgi:hypothetical protein